MSDQNYIAKMTPYVKVRTMFIGYLKTMGTSPADLFISNNLYYMNASVILFLKKVNVAIMQIGEDYIAYIIDAKKVPDINKMNLLVFDGTLTFLSTHFERPISMFAIAIGQTEEKMIDEIYKHIELFDHYTIKT